MPLTWGQLDEFVGKACEEGDYGGLLKEAVHRAEMNEVEGDSPAPWDVVAAFLGEAERRIRELEERVAVLEGVEKVEGD